MGDFKPVEDRDNIKVSNRWQDLGYTKDKIRSHKGRDYRIISKKQRDFTTMERIFRATMGAFAVIGTLGLGFLNKDFERTITNLFTQKTKTIRFGEALNKTTKELDLGLRGANLDTKEKIIAQLVRDYGVLIEHIKINHHPVDTTIPDFAISRGSKHPELKPTNLDDVIPKELQTFFGESYPSNAKMLGRLLQQGMSAELIIQALRQVDDSIIFRDSKGNVVDRGNDVIMFSSLHYSDYEFSKIDNEIFVNVSMKGYFQQPLVSKSESYVICQRINLTNKQEEIISTFSKDPFSEKRRAEFLDQLVEGTSLNTEEGLIKRLQIDYSSINGHIKLNNKVVDMGTPAFSINRGEGFTPPDTLEEMFPEEMRAYFPEDLLPIVTLLIQQGIANPLGLEAATQIITPPDIGFSLDPTYPYFEFSKIKDEITLLIKTRGHLFDVNNGEKKEHYSIEMSFNLTKPNSMVKTNVVKD